MGSARKREDPQDPDTLRSATKIMQIYEEDEAMRNTNEMEIRFDSRSENEGFARVAVAVVYDSAESYGRGSGRCKDSCFGGCDKCDYPRI